MAIQTSVRGSVVNAVIATFARFGGDAGTILQRHQLTRAMLADPYAGIPLARYVAMFEDMAALLGDPLLGARLGESVRPIDLGPSGLVFARSDSIHAAVDRLSRFVRSLQPGTHSRLLEEGDLLMWVYRIDDPAILSRRQDAEYTLSSLVSLIRSAFDRDWRPTEVQFEHAPAPGVDPRALDRIFRCPVRFHAASNGLILLTDDARKRVRHEDTELIEVLERHLLEIAPQDLPGEAWRERVAALVATGIGCRPVTIESIAADLAISPRSLQRRLADENTSFRALLREHRAGIAASRLRAGSTPIGEVAAALGYADGTSFGRAHRKWTGCSPSAIRIAGEQPGNQASAPPKRLYR